MVSAASTMSAHSAIAMPAPPSGPCTALMSGTGRAASRSTAGCTSARISSTSAGRSSRRATNAWMSPPTQNCLPRADSSKAPTVACSTAAANACAKDRFTALPASGRLKVRWPTRFLTCHSTMSSSCISKPSLWPARTARRSSRDPPRVPLPVRLAQLALQHLACARKRQRLDERDAARALVAGDLLLAMRDDLLGRTAAAGLAHDDRVHRLAPALARNADHRALCHRGVRGDGVLDFDAVDVLAAADDHVLDAVLQEHVAALVHVARIAGVHPAAAQRRRRFFGQVPVTLHHARAAPQDLADLAAGQLLVVVVDDPHFASDHRPPIGPV